MSEIPDRLGSAQYESLIHAVALNLKERAQTAIVRAVHNAIGLIAKIALHPRSLSGRDDGVAFHKRYGGIGAVELPGDGAIGDRNIGAIQRHQGQREVSRFVGEFSRLEATGLQSAAR